MSDKSGKKIFVLVLILGLLKLVYTVVKETIKVLAQIIVYFGLYVPFFYFVTGLVLVSMGYFSFDVINVDSILYYVGLSMCGVCSIVIAIKSRQRDTFASVVRGSADKIKSARQKIKPKEVEDTPVIAEYHSDDHPELFIEEHPDKFVVYLDNGSDLKLLRVEYKGRK